jgi:coenzyme F420-0:L-glutamate ligase/coenzyme F420-1:gamma-L-glutamate ligase
MPKSQGPAATSDAPVTVLVPFRSATGAKTRLDEVLDPDERAELATRLLHGVIEAVRTWGEADQIVVVGADESVANMATSMGAVGFVQRRPGMNEGLEEARAAFDGNARALLVVPADLPTVTPEALSRLGARRADLRARDRDGRDGRPGVAIIVTDADGTGTNALLLDPSGLIPFAFGDGSAAAHAAAARAVGARTSVVTDEELSFDLDTPADLERWQEHRGESHSLIALPVPGIGEVRPGDDVAALIGDAIDAASHDDSAYRPQTGDAIVVTQKIVSKAEGKIVDLSTIEPRPEAVAWGKEWGRDPRQVEVVLRESAEIIRMERGVIVSRTRHGFVCANAGVDASNVPAGTVTLLPDDPDGTARQLQQALSERFGVPLGIVVSDSFGRPWRLGIIDVAIGVAGFGALVDLRGEPDAQGRIMRTTVIAVADEIASAADLAAGKTSNRPVVIVRGARLPPEPADETQRGARAIVMAREQQLFS